jgi:hypothetical protein
MNTFAMLITMATDDVGRQPTSHVKPTGFISSRVSRHPRRIGILEIFPEGESIHDPPRDPCPCPSLAAA